MAELLFKRTLHPVGHGAFFTEEICIGDITYNVVYDCGSKSKRIVKWQIQQYAKKKRHIDLIFISHFDSDHINCLNELANYCCIDKYTTIIIPFFHPVFYQLAGIVDSRYNETIEETFSFIQQKGVRLIMVRNSDYAVYDTTLLNFKEITGEKIDVLGVSATVISSGVRIGIYNDNNELIWNYVPFNYGEDDERRIDAKLKALNLVSEDGRLKEDEIKEMLSQPMKRNRASQIDTRLSELKKEYNIIAYGNINVNSLQLLSYREVGVADVEYNSYIDCIITNLDKRQNIIHEFQCSCLYTGDTNLNITDAIKVIVNLTRKYLQSKLMLIQVPHHGSKKNYNPGIIHLAKVGFVNFKPKVKYCHFDNNIPIDYMEEDRPLLCITDTGIYSIIRL